MNGQYRTLKKSSFSSRAQSLSRAGKAKARARVEAGSRAELPIPNPSGRVPKPATLDDYTRFVAIASPMQLVDTEKSGVDAVLVKDMARRLGLPAARMFAIIGVPKATAEKKAAAGEVIAGSGGIASLGLLRLLAMAQEIAASSTAPEAVDFDAARWLGGWIERPQSSLGGRKPADLIDSPTGMEIVARLLGSIESGAYQ